MEAVDQAPFNFSPEIGLAVMFFPVLAGVAITSILWGVVHLTIGFGIAAICRRIPLGDPPVSGFGERCSVSCLGHLSKGMRVLCRFRLCDCAR